MKVVNIEDEIQHMVLEQLKKIYGISDDTALFHYVVLRSFISRFGKPSTKHRETKELVLFICQELNLPKGDSFLFKGQRIYKGIGMINSIENVIESWKFEASIRNVVDEKGIVSSMSDYIRKQQEKLSRYAKNKSKLFKNTTVFEWQWKYHALNQLNAVYKATPINAISIDGVEYENDHLEIQRTMEEVADAWVHANNYERMDTKTIAEQDVEKYLYSRLHLIEDGLTYVDRQLVIQDGRIDILAKDKDGVFVIIELKVVEDKELVWQCMYYPMQIKKMYGVSSVRMMTIAPAYSPALKVTLDQLGYVELVRFLPKVRLGTIESITFFPVCEEKAA